MSSRQIHFPLLAAAILLIASGCKPSDRSVAAPETASPAVADSTSVKHLNAEAAADLVDENPEIVILDVRTPEEFSGGHLQGALNIDFNGSGFRDEISKLDPSKSYLLHCQSGGRSTSSLTVFEELGFTEVYHLDGGFGAWRKAGNIYLND